MFDIHFFTLDPRRAPKRTIDPEYRPCHLRPTGSHQTRHANDFTGSDLKTHSGVRKSCDPEIADFEQDLSSLYGRFLMRYQLPTHHERHDTIPADLLSSKVSTVMTVPQDDHAIRQFFDFCHPVRNKDDTHPLFTKSVYESKQNLGLMKRE